jgi:2-dehydropantoate 2-reductase
MRILVMAAGAVGGYFGGLLARADNEVKFVARGEALRAIRSSGVRVSSVTSGDFALENVVAVDRLDGDWQADLVLFCVKSYQNEEALEAIRPAVGAETAVLTLQNGIGGGDQLADAFGSRHVMLGAAYVSAERKGPNEFAELGGTCQIVFGEPDGSESERAKSVHATFHDAGIDAVLSDNVNEALWNKLVYICALSGMSCIARAPFAEVLDSPQAADLTARAVHEAAAVGRASGIDLAADLEERTLLEFEREKTELVSSMYMDLMAGKPLELMGLNGAVSELGRRHGVETPVNDFITACLSVAHNRAMA